MRPGPATGYVPSGGLLVPGPTEAALVIDVNTAQDSRAGDTYRHNLRAAAGLPVCRRGTPAA